MLESYRTESTRGAVKEGIVSAATAEIRDCKRDQCILLKPVLEKVKVWRKVVRVCGLRSEAIQKRLLTEKALTLDMAVEISVSMETAAKEALQLQVPHCIRLQVTLMKSTSNATGVIRWDM